MGIQVYKEVQEYYDPELDRWEFEVGDEAGLINAAALLRKTADLLQQLTDEAPVIHDLASLGLLPHHDIAWLCAEIETNSHFINSHDLGIPYNDPPMEFPQIEYQYAIDKEDE